MNWELVKWVAGVLLTVAAIKFVWTAFRTLFSKENFEDALDSVGTACGNAATRMANGIKKKIVKAKKANVQKDNTPKVYIR